MGDIADMMLEGLMCEECGEIIDDWPLLVKCPKGLKRPNEIHCCFASQEEAPAERRE